MAFMTITNHPVQRATITEPWVFWDDAFTMEEIDAIVAYCDANAGEFQKAGITGTLEQERIEKVRISDIKWLYKNDETAWIFDRLNYVFAAANEMFYGFDLNGYATIQYTTYDAEFGGKYDWHLDTHLGVPKTIPTSQLSHEGTRKLSLTLVLNDDYEGGEFLLNQGSQDNPTVLPTKKGRCVLFPSFMGHKVNPVTSGVRKSLVTWCSGPKFR